MKIEDIKAFAEREGATQIIVSFLDEDHITVGVKVTKDGFGSPQYGDYVTLGADRHSETCIGEAVDRLIVQLGDALS